MTSRITTVSRPAIAPPARSRLPAGRSSSERNRASAATRTRPPATLSAKIARQSATASTSAPYNGPTTLPSSCTAPTIPSGTPRLAGG